RSPEALTVGKMIVGLLSNPPLRQPEAAERVARKLAGLGPKGRCVLAEVLAGRGRHDEAAAELEAAAKGDAATAGAAALGLAVKPAAGPRWVALAERFLAEGSGTLAPDRLLQLALIYHLKREFPREVAVYERLLAAQPSNFQFLNNMAWTLSEEMRRPEDGLRRADEAIARAGPMPQLLDTRGVILTRLGRLGDAVKDLETAAAGMPRDPTVHYHLARAYLRQNNADAARKARDRALGSGLTREQLQPCDQSDWDAVMKRG